ncbi:MAG: ABC transporter permease [Peptococcales bacterium]|jgi:ribose transport system permease protein
MDGFKAKLRSSSRIVTLIALNSAIVVFMTIVKGEAFFSSTNFEAILISMACDLLLACGMTFVLILGGVDLSVGAIVAFSSVVVALLMRAGIPVPLSIVITLIFCIATGFLNGLMVGLGNLAPFVSTLGMQTALRGMCYVLTLGYQVTGLPKSFLSIGQGKVLGIPGLVIISIVITVILGFLLPRLKVFKQLYLVGTSKQTAFMSGIPVNKVIILGFALSGCLAGISGILMSSRYALGFAGFFVGAETRAIAAAVTGGAIMSGGEGSMFGTALGILLVALVNNAFVMFNGRSEWQNAISGIILIIALFVDVMRTRRALSKGWI